MFEDRNVIITGGSSGLGLVLAARILKDGGRVALVARDPKKLESARAQLAADDAAERVQAFSCDVSDPAAVERCFGEIATRLGAPQILINSAGVLTEGYFETVAIETFRRVMDINFFGVLHCVKAVLPHFKAQGSGHIVNVGSIAGLMGVFGYTPYCASKHALSGLTATLRAELLPQQIRVQLACPPEFESPMVEDMPRTPENRAVVHSVRPMRTEDVADAVLRGMASSDYLIVPGSQARVVALAERLIPGIARSVADRRVRAVYRGPDAK